MTKPLIPPPPPPPPLPPPPMIHGEPTYSLEPELARQRDRIVDAIAETIQRLEREGIARIYATVVAARAIHAHLRIEWGEDMAARLRRELERDALTPTPQPTTEGNA